MPHVGNGADAVVGETIDDDRRAVDAVALVPNLLVAHAFELTGSALDCALDGVLGHVVVHRLVDGEAQARIGRNVAAAQLGGNGDFPDQAGEDLAALGVGRGLFVLDVRPLAMAGHGSSRSSIATRLIIRDPIVAAVAFAVLDIELPKHGTDAACVLPFKAISAVSKTGRSPGAALHCR